MKAKSSLILLFSFLLFGSCHRALITRNDTAVSDEGWSRVVAYADLHLSKTGVLIQKKDGYAYVKVDDGYIRDLFPRLNVAAEYKMPPYFRRSDSPGAHISVVYENEHVKLKEQGQFFKFTLTRIRVVKVNAKTSYIVLDVSAPELEKLRQRYGLSPQLQHHEFHITLAKKTIES